MWYLGASSTRTPLSSLLREVFQSDLATSAHRLSEPRRSVLIRPLAYRRPGAQRDFSTTHQVQIHQSSILLSSSDIPDNIPNENDKTSAIPSAKNESGDRTTDHSASDVNASESSFKNKRPYSKRRVHTGKTGRETTKGTRNKSDARGDQPESNGTEEKPKSSEAKPKTWRDAIKSTGPPKKKEHWQIQKAALKEKFKEGWNPPKKLSPDAMEGIRHLHQMAPDQFTTPVLAEQFKVSPEAIRRILKSKWRASETEMEDRRKRWERRHDRIWAHMAELGLRPRTKATEKYQDSQNLLYEPKAEDDKP
ncbi:mitochondrial ribosome assembly protein RRG9 [Aspergillus saccharolyticus JOP 1030-1]|uniref:Required for respiratory growth protein 9, mitochondrial n=1 Tax=Aspergillus saccharolyticus JOP 1030-1 TaxID=1450539 RepID=A0A318ZAA4_9EURO|nr:hypothetical protein BP01DRAFT_424277 [Aspergillus saccharolyticus JOP 1030-1]PYH44219.1 hypothetical protein BP01DRAFT_424277 [Aspergillus saccharolyticus JOP 1030-1]